MLSEIEGDARAMAGAALDRLRGISKQSEPVARLPTAPVSYFDWQVIQRFGGDSEKLPATTKFINRPLTLWSQYRGYVIAGVLVILLLSGLVIALLVQRRRRAQAEKAMHASAEKYRSIYENIQDVYVETTVDGTICEISPQIVTLTRGRYARDDFLGKSASVFYADPKRRAEYVRALRDQGEVRDFETVFQHRDGLPIYCSVSARLITDQQGRSERIVATLRDIGDRKRAEDAVHRLNAELEQRVVERTAKLEKANRQLETFTYSVAHDLKAPLRGIDGYGRLLLDEFADKLDDQGRQFLRNMREGTQKMNQLLDDLLVYSRLDFQDAPVEQLDLRELVHALLAREDEEVRARGVTINVGESMGTVVADREGLSMALRNLLGNALKFTRTTPSPLIEIGGKVEAGGCLPWVRDNGIGFDMKYHDQIFAIFQRLQRSEDYPGTGVGLAIVSKAMERMGGRAWAESQPGRGATFYLEMPGS
jgi:PAS domain S-box-containing protein